MHKIDKINQKNRNLSILIIKYSWKCKEIGVGINILSLFFTKFVLEFRIWFWVEIRGWYKLRLAAQNVSLSFLVYF